MSFDSVLLFAVALFVAAAAPGPAIAAIVTRVIAAGARPTQRINRGSSVVMAGAAAAIAAR